MKFHRTLFSMLFLFANALLAQVANHVVISEVYGGGGNSGATLKNDFVELYNPTNSPVTMTNWSIQYQASGSTGQFGSGTTTRTIFSGTISPRGYFLIQMAQGSGGTTPLPTPDAVGTIAIAATAGKIALVQDSLQITNATDPTVVDFVGFGTGTNKYEGTGPAPAPSNTTSIERKASATSTATTMGAGGSEERAGNGWDSNNNASDFFTRAPEPQNSASPKEPVTAGTALAGIGTASISPAILKADTGLTVTLTIRGDAAGTVTKIVTLVPSPFTWSRSSSDVIVTRGGTPTVRVSQDSVILTNVNLPANDSVFVQVRRLAASDTTLRVDVRVETGAGGDSTAAISLLPRILLYGTPRPIFDMRANNASGVPLLKDKPVTVRGVVTVGNQFNGPSYLQDVSGGIAVFDNSFSSTRQIGDEVTITGTVIQFNGLTELEQVTVHQVHSTGNIVTPVIVTASQVARDGSGGSEIYEGLLVQLRRVRVVDQNNQSFASWSGNSNYKLIDATDTVTVRIDGDTDIGGSSAPQTEFDIVGVVGQFVQSSPFLGGYQILPRSKNDIVSRGPVIEVNPIESNITASSLRINWQTRNPGTSHVRYGLTKAYELGERSVPTDATSHALTLDGLRPATMYNVQAFSVSGADTSFASNRIVSTASQGSTGQISVYFNKTVDATVGKYGTANAQVNLLQRLTDRINAATFSIDCAVYSLSGTVGQSIANALIVAKNRGVKVRTIIEKDNLVPRSDGSIPGTKTLFENMIAPSGIPWIADDFDAANGGVGLHHNKFFVFDYRGGQPDKIWIWTGSWNPTDPGTNDDMQNSIEIQDQALAGGYEAEFNEMWGSDTDAPNASASRFGARKTDNTPHIFNISGVQVESYFSPSDRTTSQIINTLNKAQHSINVAMLTLTRFDIAATLKVKKDAGLKVRGVLDNGTDTGSQYSFLLSSGLDFRIDPNATALLHHKYAVVDAERSLGTPSQYVITGSHNWSSAAENSNNENTLIILDNRVGNLYLQEFVARYKEAGGTDNIIVNVERTGEAIPTSFWLGQNYPNPFNPATSFEFQVQSSGFVTLKVFDVLGREMATLVNEPKQPGTYKVTWDARQFPTGVYLYRMNAGSFVETRKMVLVR